MSDEFEEAASLLLSGKLSLEAEREGLRDTPRRFAEAWEEQLSGYMIDPQEVLKAFEDGAQDDQIIVQTNIPFYSTCEHHLVPFFGVVHIGYLPYKQIVGLSKLKRLVDVYSRRLQVQERLANQIATALRTGVNALGVGVVIQARHLCMEMRGIRTAGTITTSSAMLGTFRADAPARAELLTLMRLAGAAAAI